MNNNKNNNIYSLPEPSSYSWREAYETKNLASYKVKGKEEVSFILESSKFSGGQSLDLSEYPFFGMWSSEALNEKPHTITVSGFLRGENYIEKRNALIETLRVPTSDDAPGYLFLPLWGRMKVVVVSFNTDENASENGQCKIEITCNRAGESEKERIVANSYIKPIRETANELKQVSINYMSDSLSLNDSNVFISSINKATNKLSEIISTVQGQASNISDMSRTINTISATIAQGVKTPGIIAEAFTNIIDSIVTSIFNIKQSAIESVDKVKSFASNIYAYLNIDGERNENKAILQFVSFKDINLLENGYIKEEEIKAANETANFIKLISLYAVSLLLSESTKTKEKLKNYLKLYDALDSSIDKDDALIYAACESLKLSLIYTLSSKTSDSEKSITLNKSQTLLSLEEYLSCDKLRELNLIEDSFAIGGHTSNIKNKVLYV